MDYFWAILSEVQIQKLASEICYTGANQVKGQQKKHSHTFFFKQCYITEEHSASNYIKT